ncbi:MAG: methyltransferase [Sulfurovum sp. AS07-7]|nr:MAG: methyltransferase [Sulfurovum sp. AS07-7]
MREKMELKTKIIAGKFKGKMIEIPAINTTRSSKSILKESFFNTLQNEIMDKNFVEVFAGSGSIGLEALSRGAKECFFIEKNSIAFDTLKRNIHALEVANQTHILLGNSFTKFDIVLDMLKKSATKTYFYFDPPFAIREGMDDIYEKSLNLIRKIDSSLCAMVIIEHMTSLELPQEIGSVTLLKRKKFGKSTLSYYIPKA